MAQRSNLPPGVTNLDAKEIATSDPEVRNPMTSLKRPLFLHRSTAPEKVDGELEGA